MKKWTPMNKHPHLYKYETSKGITLYAIRRGYYAANNKRAEFTKSGFKNWHDADKELKQFEADLAMNKLDKLNSGHITLDRYWKKYLNQRLKTNRWRPSTAKKAVASYEQRIKPAFGNMNLRDIRRPQVQEWLDDIAAQGYAKETSRSLLIALNSILNAAIQDEYLDKNRTHGVTTSGKEPRPKSLQPEDFAKWLDVAKHTLKRYDYSVIALAAVTGMRRGEVCGLRTNSITFSKRPDGSQMAEIKIDKSRTIYTDSKREGDPLKTNASYRTIYVSGSIIDDLSFAVLTAKNLRSQHPAFKKDPLWLWQTINGTPQYPTRMNQLFKKVNDITGLHVSPHVFRHFFASQAIASQAPAIDVMHWLGHSSMEMTKEYTRPTKQSTSEVFNSFEHYTNG